MSQAEAARLTREAKDRVKEAITILSVAQVNVDPSAGPLAATATVPLDAASTLLDHAADELDAEAGRGLRRLSRDAAARGREAVAVAFIPWPFVYAGIGALARSVRGLHDEIPELVPLEPVVSDATMRSPMMPVAALAHRSLERNPAIAAALAPALRDTLDAVESIGTYPIPSLTALMDGLFSDPSSTPLPRIQRERLEPLLLPEMFPIAEKEELARRLYPVISLLQANHHASTSPTPHIETHARSSDGWTKVVWASLAAGTYRFDFSLNGSPMPDTWLRWKRYSVFPPWYTEGAHNTRDPFNAIFVCDPYCDFWFSAVRPGLAWTISGELTPCLGIEVRG